MVKKFGIFLALWCSIVLGIALVGGVGWLIITVLDPIIGWIQSFEYGSDILILLLVTGFLAAMYTEDVVESMKEKKEEKETTPDVNEASSS